MIETQEVYHPIYTNTDKFIILITGGRGCEKPTQEVIMADMTIKQIKDIKVGDLVMGVDGTPRKVIDTHNGRSQMYRVKQSNADDYYVNDGHILTLQQEEDGKIIDIPISWWFLFDFDKRKSYRRYGCKVKDAFNGDFSLERTDVTITDAGIGDWVGIELDGDKRYLHSDGTVTHNSGKSFNASTFIERLTFELNKYIEDSGEVRKIVHNILYTRYTMTSANISVIPEFLEKIEADGTQQYFSATRTDVTNLLTGSTIMFRGIKTSSGNQTAKLKSIHGITTFVCDEAEEWTSEKEFDTIMLSIRTKGIQNRIIIIMNPTDSNHFIYQKYIKDTHKIVEYDGVPVQISTHPNVLHIHTSYLDNREHLSEEFIKEVELMKENNPEKYAHIVMGRWSDVAEGAIFKKWGIVDSFPAECRHVARGLDMGYTHDPSACVKVGVLNNDLYIDEQFYRTGMGTAELIRELKKDSTAVYSESADPRLVDEIAMSGVLIYPVDKSGQSILAGIEGLKDYDNIFVTKRSYNVQEELRNYTWDKDKNGNYINQPIDSYNHACFVGETLITTDKGKVRIDQIKAGDMVMTSQGYKRVLNVFDNGIKQVKEYTITTNNGIAVLNATADHRIKTEKVWKQLQSLVKGDKIYLANSLMTKSTTSTKANATSQEGVIACTSLCGSISMVQYLKGIMYTTKTAILTTTQSLISNWLRVLYTYQNTLEQTCKMKSTLAEQEKTCTKQWSVQKSGMQAKKAESGTESTENKSQPICNLSSEFANGVVRNMKQSQLVKTDSAVTIAERVIATIMEWIMRSVYALCVASISSLTNIQNRTYVALNNVEVKHGFSELSCIQNVKVSNKRNAKVYDLEVEDVHEYFANGVLVHNCDAVRYWYLGKMLGKILRKKENGKVNNNISNFGF